MAVEMATTFEAFLSTLKPGKEMRLPTQLMTALTILLSIALTSTLSYQAAADDGVRESTKSNSVKPRTSFVYYGTREIRVGEHFTSVASDKHDAALSAKLNPFVYYGTRELDFRKPELNAHQPTFEAVGFDGNRPFVYYGTRSIKVPTK